MEKSLLPRENSKAYADKSIQVCACEHPNIVNSRQDRLKRCKAAQLGYLG
jgi:hypothetical protein